MGAGPSRKGRFAALFLENRPRKNLLFLLFRPLLLFFEGLFRVEIYKLEQNRADQLFYRLILPQGTKFGASTPKNTCVLKVSASRARIKEC